MKRRDFVTAGAALAAGAALVSSKAKAQARQWKRSYSGGPTKVQPRPPVLEGAGYRPVEFAMFGQRREDRKQLYLEAFEVLRMAWKGEPFEYRGHPDTKRVCVRGQRPRASRLLQLRDGFHHPY